jgi:hypothetical protein
MQNKISTVDAPLISRRECAALLPAVRNRGKDLKRLVPLVHAELDAADLNLRPLKLAKWLLECTLVRGRNFIYCPSLRFIGGPLNFSDKEVCEILLGYDKRENGVRTRHVAGLEEIGFVHRRELRLDKGWLLTVRPDWSRWDIPRLYSSASHSKAVMETDALCAEFQRRMNLREIDDWFPDLSAVLADLDADVALEKLDAPLRSENETAGGAGRSFSSNTDAPDVLSVTGCGANASRHSESRNADLRGNGRAIPTFGTPSRARARCNWNLEIGIENLQLQVASDASRDELEKIKVALNDGDERRFIAAARLVISARDWDDGRKERHQGDGGKWRNRFKHAPTRSLAIAVMLDCVEQRNFSGNAAEDLWFRWGGVALDAARFASAQKKLEDS